MESRIPVHRFPQGQGVRTRIERIVPCDAPVRNQVHRHDFHELFLFTKGSGTHMIDLEQYQIAVPCLHVVRPGQVHKLDRSADMEGTVVMFSGEAELGHGNEARSELFGHSSLPQTAPLSLERSQEAEILVSLMEKELSRPEGPLIGLLDGYLGNLLILCLNWVQGSAGDDTFTDRQDTTRRFLELLEAGFLMERSVSHYAGLLAISPDHLNEKIRKRTGRTASTIIQERTLLEAKRLLLHSDLSIKEIGFALNMKDPAYFTRWFTRMVNSTPTSYRGAVRDMYKH